MLNVDLDASLFERELKEGIPEPCLTPLEEGALSSDRNWLSASFLKQKKVHSLVLQFAIRVTKMTEKILSLRLKSQDEKTIAELLKTGRYRSKTQILREALLLLKEKENEITLTKVISRRRKPSKLDINTLSGKLANSWITNRESGDLLDADRER